MKIKVVGMDPSTSNWGICKATVDVRTLTFVVDDLILIQTEPETKKGVRKDSDDIRRAKVVRDGMINACVGASFAISEIPFMNPGSYASANFNSGLVTGVLASCPIPLIQVFPSEVKEQAVGIRSATKIEMIEWATKRFPHAPWMMRKLKGKMVPVASNEHLADAVASINAGLKSEQFLGAIAMYRGILAA
ncbi:hypothetical protein [Ferrovum sp.]|uniref:hypothetical protein n=1 Tax=Ferrovum sp. TaxID=2609467 RepID=UPI0026181278|nr:hypothetical protein [Ferrovum sp.]